MSSHSRNQHNILSWIILHVATNTIYLIYRFLLLTEHHLNDYLSSIKISVSYHHSFYFTNSNTSKWLIQCKRSLGKNEMIIITITITISTFFINITPFPPQKSTKLSTSTINVTQLIMIIFQNYDRKYMKQYKK